MANDGSGAGAQERSQNNGVRLQGIIDHAGCKIKLKA